MPSTTVRATDSAGGFTTRSVSWAVSAPASTGLPPLIGSSSHIEDWAERKEMLEATGGSLEARRVFVPEGFLDSSLTSRLQACVTEGLVPVVSFTIQGFNWAQIRAGNADSAITTAANRIKAVMGTRPIYVTVHHEPDKQADAKTVGEGGNGADYGPMLARAAGIIRGIYPQAKVGPILNGWWFSAQARGFSDAEINYWMPASSRAEFDFISADHYAALNESEPSLLRAQRMVAWMNRVGFAGAAGIGETNCWTPTEINNIFNYAKTTEKFRNGFIMLWNSEVANATAEDWKPVHETGLLDEFQLILKNWRS